MSVCHSFTDYSNLNTGYLPNFSSNWSNTAGNVSTFQLNVNNSASNTNANISGHLMFSFFTTIKPGFPVLILTSLFVALPLGKIKRSIKAVLVAPIYGIRTLGPGNMNFMKRYGHLYSMIYDVENIKLAHLKARRDKSFYKEVQMVNSDIEGYAQKIHQMLKDKTYRVSEYAVSTLNDKGKERHLMKLPYYPDRIVQWAIMLQIEGILLEVIPDFSCASVPGKGIHAATKLTRKYLKDKKGTAYCLKMDISKYFPSVNHDILKKLLRRKIKDKDLLWLLDLIIDSYPGEKGIPIGSYLSQYFANFYLASFGHWLKEELHLPYAVIYMDDVVILSDSKEHLHSIFPKIKEYLKTELNLDVKPNWQVFPVGSRGIDFVGYRHFHKYTLLRKSTCKRLKQKLTKIKEKADKYPLINYSEWCTINSYAGWLKWCNSCNLKRKYTAPLMEASEKYYNTVIVKRKEANYG